MMFIEALHWIIDNPGMFFSAFNRHLLMCTISLTSGLFIAIPLGFWVARSPRASFVSINTAGSLRSIPSLAILSATMPLVGIGLMPSVIALTILAIPPLLINTIIGIRQIDPAILDAAKGMGMGQREILLSIEAPLSVPSILAGARTSAIQVIGGAALASFIGGGGLGDFINAGIAIMNIPRLIVGALPIAILAIMAEVLFSRLERSFSQRR